MFDKNRIGRRQVLWGLGAAGASGLASAYGQPVGPVKMPPPGSLKTIGILGGMGPQATMDFEARMHRVAQKRIPPRQNGGYPPMVVYYHRYPPFEVGDDLKPRFPIQPDPRLLDAARRLGEWADFLIVTSNGPHLIQGDIERASGRKVLSIIDVALQEIQRLQFRRVGVLGFGEPTIYTNRLEVLHIAYETIESSLRDRLDREIMKVMEGRNDATSSATAKEAVARLRAKNVDAVILGCTELPLLLESLDQDLVDPAQLLAEAAVSLSMQG